MCLGRREISRAFRDVGDEEQGGGRARIRAIGGGEAGPAFPGRVHSTAPEFRPAQGKQNGRRLGRVRKLGEEAAVARRGLVPRAGGVGSLAAHLERGPAHGGSERLLEERVDAGARLVGLARLEVHLGQAQRRIPAEGRRPRSRGDQLEPAPRLRGLPRVTLDLTAQEEHVGPRAGIEVAAEDLLLEGARFIGALLLRQPAIHREDGGEAERSCLVGGVQGPRLGERSRGVAEVEESQDEPGADPEDLGSLRIGGQKPAIGLHRGEGLPRRPAPPRLAKKRGVDHGTQAAVSEALEPGHRVLVLTELAQGIAEPEGGLGGHGNGQGLAAQAHQNVARLGVASETVESDASAKLNPRDQLGRQPALDEGVERFERARRLVGEQREPAILERRIGAHVGARIWLHDLEHQLRRRLGPAHPDQGLPQPVAGLAEHGRVAAPLDRVLQRLARLLVLAALELGAAAFHELRHYADHAAQWIAG